MKKEKKDEEGGRKRTHLEHVSGVYGEGSGNGLNADPLPVPILLLIMIDKYRVYYTYYTVYIAVQLLVIVHLAPRIYFEARDFILRENCQKSRVCVPRYSQRRRRRRGRAGVVVEPHKGGVALLARNCL